MDRKLVSIIVPCYNQGGFLEETLKSVLEQTYLQWECIIVNDGSIDNTHSVANKFCEKDKRFRYYYQENQGVVAARNNAIRSSQGEYILPLDGDDIIDSTYVEKAVKILQSNDIIKIVYCDAEFFGRKQGRWQLPPFSMENMLADNCIFCTALFRRCDYDKTIGYNPNMKGGLEDWDFWLSLLESGGMVHKIDEVLFYYRIRTNSRNNSINEEKASYLRYNLWANHKNLYAKYYMNPIETFEYKTLKKKHVRLKNSTSYKIGNILFSPIRLIRNLFYND